MVNLGLNLELVDRHSEGHVDRLPGLCESAFQAGAGCVLAYGHDLDYAQRRVGWYAARILKGAAPADLPVEQPDAWKLTINLQDVTRRGLTIPLSIVGRADEVIE